MYSLKMKPQRDWIKKNTAGLCAMFLFLCSVCLIYLFIINTNLKVYTSTSTSVKSNQRIVIGIFSKQENVCLRNAQRTMFISQARKYSHLDINTVFLLDEPSSELEDERKLNNDIVYLNSTIRGWDKAFAWKLYVWYKIVAETYPDADLVGRIDDDVFCCTPQVFDRLKEINDPFLYYGYHLSVKGTLCPTADCVDDMFLFVGMELVRRIVRGNVCDGQLRDTCLKSVYPWQNVRHWIHLSSNNTKVVHDNSKMIYFYSGTSSGKETMKRLYHRYKHEFCKKYILFHKASPKYIYQMNKANGQLLGDLERSRIADESSRKAKSCI